MIMYTKNIAELSRRSHMPYRTAYSYVRGEKRPKPETARILAMITGSGTDEETLIWMSKDQQKIETLMQNWKCCGKRIKNEASVKSLRPVSGCADSSQSARKSMPENDSAYILLPVKKGGCEEKRT